MARANRVEAGCRRAARSEDNITMDFIKSRSELDNLVAWLDDHHGLIDRSAFLKASDRVLWLVWRELDVSALVPSTSTRRGFCTLQLACHLMGQLLPPELYDERFRRLTGWILVYPQDEREDYVGA